MKKEHLHDAIGMVDEDLILATNEKRKKRRIRWVPIVAAAACLAIAAGLLAPRFLPEKIPGQAPLGKGKANVKLSASDTRLQELIALAKYPEMAQYPTEDGENWEAYNAQYELWIEDRAQFAQGADDSESAVHSFSQSTVPQFLSGAGTENRVYSPVNVYMALAMLAELTDDNSRAQILELLEMESIEALREQARKVWEANYCDDGAVTSVLANSVWLNEGINFHQDTMERLADTYYASSYQGTMGSEEFNALLQSWLNEQTGGLLEKQAENITMDPQTILTLASTVYFRGKWADEFSESQTVEDTFYAPGGEQTVEFMKQDLQGQFYWGEEFTAVKKYVQEGGCMWLILPNEGVSVDALLASGEAMDMVCAQSWENSKSVNVHLSMPKFDVDSQMDLSDGLKGLGVTDVFDWAVSDFTPTTSDRSDIFVSEVNHAARVTVDEEGCTAAAFTVILMECASAFMGDEVDFTLDRPFLFVLTGVTDQPLFAGVVNQP